MNLATSARRPPFTRCCRILGASGAVGGASVAANIANLDQAIHWLKGTSVIIDSVELIKRRPDPCHYLAASCDHFGGSPKPNSPSLLIIILTAMSTRTINNAPRIRLMKGGIS